MFLGDQKYVTAPRGLVTYFFSFCTPYTTYETPERTNFQFGAEIDHKRYYPKDGKIGSSACAA